MILSILIPTIPSRKKMVQKLLDKVERMTENYNDIQVLCLYDNKSVTIGTKRQKLFDLADGEYVQFLDDDDDISEDYIDKVYPLLVNGKHDLITFQFRYTDETGVDRLYKFDEPDCQPNHTHLWRKSVITKPFDDIQYGEDREWSLVNTPNVKSRHHIPETLYYYQYDTNISESH